MNFRQINEIEKEIIISSLSNTSPKSLRIFEDLKTNLYISIGGLISINKYPEIYLVSKNQYNLLNSLITNKIISAGLYFGFIKKGNFFLSLEGLEFLFKSNLFSDLKRINVDDKVEKSILYGNNILKNMILKSPVNIKQKDILVILNKFDEVIAIAQSKQDHQNIQQLKPNEIIAINLNDKGYYLRKNQ
ncbi:MAG: hypothetical protein HWN81_24125 [Candidatus Lokiarchaeota archaeon]|nr:hypothetical protein [Candidatus Lokiarchaeota archaeon]